MAEKTLPTLVVELNTAIKLNQADIMMAETEEDLKEALAELESLEEHLILWKKKIDATKNYLEESYEESFFDKINIFK